MYLDSHCDAKGYECAKITDHTLYELYDKTKEECLRLCCEDENCLSFDHREKTGYNCALISQTKDDVGENFKTSKGNPCWNHYELLRSK